MTSEISAMSIFCEDVRHEVNGQRTLVGLLGDSISVDTIPGTISRVALFSRISVPIDFLLESLTLTLFDPDGNVIYAKSVDAELLPTSKQDAAARGNPSYGIVSDVKMQQFKVEKAGVFQVEMQVNEQVVKSGFLNIALTGHEH